MLAVALPDLASELAEAQLELERAMGAASGGEGLRAARGNAAPPPLAVVIDGASDHEAPERLSADSLATLDAEQPLHAVNGAAEAVGSYRGQALGKALTARRGPIVFRLSAAALGMALARLADILRRHGGLVSYQAPDTLWLELTTKEPRADEPVLAEVVLAEEVQRSFAALGHRAQVAVADGPWVARAFALFGELDRNGVRVVAPAETEEALLALPVIALPLSAAARLELARRGALTIADLRGMPSATLVEALLRSEPPQARRGRQRRGRVPSEPFPLRGSPRELLELVRGRDRALLPARAAAPLAEGLAWEQATSSAAALDVALGRLCTRLGARLMGRQEAAVEVALLLYSSAEAEPRRATLRPRVHPCSIEGLLSAARARLREVQQRHGVIALELSVLRTEPARPSQAVLAFAEPSAGPPDAAALASLLDALAARVGARALGLDKAASKGAEGNFELPELVSSSGRPWSRGVPTRWLRRPLPLPGSLSKNQIVVLEAQAYVIRARHFEGRSSGSGGRRDYFRLWLAALDDGSAGSAPAGLGRRGFEVLVYRDARGAQLEAFFD